MLVELNIENFAIIKDIKVSFTRGLNIITGETGTGKSILIEALGIILGSRSNKDFIRTGEDAADLEAVFYVENQNPVIAVLANYGIELDKDGLLIISKQISKDLPSLSKVNGKNVNLSMLADITRHLIDIFGQHEHQSLLNVSNHKLLLDSFGGRSLAALKEDIELDYRRLKKLEAELMKISLDELARDREIDILDYQINEINEASLDPSKDKDIKSRYEKFKNLTKIRASFSNLINKLDSGSFSDMAIINSLDKSILELAKLSDLDSDIASVHSRLTDVKYELEDIYRGAVDYISSMDFDDEQFSELERRLDTLNTLKSKYGEDLESILNFKEQAELRLEALINQDEEIETIKNKIDIVRGQLLEKSKVISDYRKKLAAGLEEEISQQLEYLNMSKVRFKVKFTRLKDYTYDGIDDIEFLISTNIGEDLKALSKIASGGEMSRIMLAFKNILAKYDDIQTLIFDEIDTGISGRTAQLVGEKIYDIARDRQVICISHLPQITALADSHYSISKVVKDRKTGSYIKKLSYNERVDELARLIGGVDLTETTKKHAMEMIEMSRRLKEE